ncbi:MAG: hypothetical protein GX100_05360 [candidate division WS1 bacterium]|nr:hypothetical protein [candidate division WS1 bacterium]
MLILPGAAAGESLNFVSRVGNVYSYSLTARANPRATVTVTGLTGVTGAAVLAPASSNPHRWEVQSFTANEVVFHRAHGGGVDDVTNLLTFQIFSPDGPGTVNWTTDKCLGTPTSGTTTGPVELVFEAMVSAHDNWISFNDNPGTGLNEGLLPAQGTFRTPVPVMARYSPASAWGPESGVPNANGCDLAGFQVHTTKRLALTVNLGGHMSRVTPGGTAFGGGDTRKPEVWGGALGPYQLATQWKVKFRGLFLNNPAGTTFASPSSGQLTALNTWTQWGASSDDPPAETGWLWPSPTDAWTGTGIMSGSIVPSLSLFVERNQGANTGNAAAEFWFTERVQRRGEQDVAGNYRQDILITLVFAE